MYMPTIRDHFGGTSTRQNKKCRFIEKQKGWGSLIKEGKTREKSNNY